MAFVEDLFGRPVVGVARGPGRLVGVQGELDLLGEFGAQFGGRLEPQPHGRG